MGKRANIKTKNKDNNPVFFIVFLIVFFVLGLVSISILATTDKINDENDKMQDLNRQYNQALVEQSELQNVLAGNKDEYMERRAREDLGYAMPDERIYYNITPNN